MEATCDFKRLEKNISEMIYEGMVKIGYMEKSVSVYYDAGLLSWLLGISEAGNQPMDMWKACIRDFKEYVKPRYGDITVKRKADRFEFQIPEAGVRYIYEHNESREFLTRLVAVLGQQEVTLERVLDVFREVSTDIIVREVDDSEFQYIVSFTVSTIDEFKYCFTFDEMGHYYHRLLDYDLDKILHHKH